MCFTILRFALFVLFLFVASCCCLNVFVVFVFVCRVLMFHFVIEVVVSQIRLISSNIRFVLNNKHKKRLETTDK